MAGEIITPNMSLTVPGTGITSGPQYANDVNNSLTLIDGHTHAIGSGVQITPAAININAVLSFNGYSISGVGALTLTPQTVTPAIESVYVSGVDLYYLDGNGNVIRITQSGSVSGAAGTITGLPSGTASAAYGSSTFVFQSATNTAATIDGASYILRNTTVNSKGLTLSPPNAMTSSYGLTLPSSNSSGATQVMTLDTSGNMGSISYDTVGQNMTSVGADAIAETMDVTGANAIAATMNNANFGGKSTRVVGANIVVSNVNDTNGLSILRGGVASNGGITVGDGFSVSVPTTGTYSITYASAFLDTAVPVVIAYGGASACYLTAIATTGFTVVSPVGATAFTFIVIGQRS